MFFNHHFAHQETLMLACDWLGRFGFAPDRRQGSPWLSIRIEPGQRHEVELLVNAAEMTDPQGWPSFWDEARVNPFAVGCDRSCEAKPADDGVARRLEIGWHSVDGADSLHDPEIQRICDAMGH